MDELIELLNEVNEDVDYAGSTSLIDDGLLDSFDILQIVAELNDHYDITIPAEEVIPQNFNSAQAMLAMVNRLKDDN